MEKIQRERVREMYIYNILQGKCASGGKKKSGIYDFSGAPSEKREENDIQPGDCGGGGPVVVQRDRNISNRLPCRPRAVPMPNGHSLFFPECPRKHPVYVPPSDCY